VIALVVIPYFNVNVEGEAIWSRPAQNLKIVLITIFLLLAFLAFYDAWTIFVPTALVAALLLFSYTARAGEKGSLQMLACKPVSWWVMTWFIAVALCLTVVGTFFRGPGWSWVWPWRTHVS
jgi:ABC-type transport system involved in multi-copper enzyme maturation permease subunit